MSLLAQSHEDGARVYARKICAPVTNTKIGNYGVFISGMILYFNNIYNK